MDAMLKSWAANRDQELDASTPWWQEDWLQQGLALNKAAIACNVMAWWAAWPKASGYGGEHGWPKAYTLLVAAERQRRF